MSQSTTISIPGSVTSIGDLAFYYSGLTNVTIPGSVTNLGLGAFAVCSSLTNVTMQNGVENIGEAGFNFCTNLTSVTIPESVTSIGERAFWFCTALPAATIPSNVTNIGQYAFSACSSMTNIAVDAHNASYSSVDGVLFNKDQTVLIQFPGGRGGSFTVPNTVTSIGSYAVGYFDPAGYSFVGPYLPSCMSLTNVIVSSTVTNIESKAFDNLINLASVHFEGNAPVCDGALNNGITTVYYLPDTTGWDAFALSAGVPTALWLPAIETGDASFGVQTNQFGFNINWASDRTVVVEASTGLANPDWIPVATNTLTAGTSFFSDSQWTNYPSRFYRLRSP